MPLDDGDKFADYTIVRQIGSGGMGEVYLAQHPRLPRQDALKILRPDISSDDSFRQRFIRESDSIAALQHPHIVTVYDRGNTEGQLWIATQYVDGADAARLLRDRYPAGMPVDEATAITTAIAQALDHAHERGLIHRDVKPANILLAQPDRDGTRRIYLADFGIARPLDDPVGLTSTNFTLGTFAYAAPEQLMGKAIDGRADQYALAATAYHLLTGTPVFPDSNQIAVISQHLTEPAPAPSKIRPELAPLNGAFARALAKNPDDRYLSCRDFAKALAAAAGSSGAEYSASAPTQQAPIPAITPAGASTRRRSPARGLLAAAVLLALMAGWALLWHPRAQQDQASISPSTPAAPSAIDNSQAAPSTPVSPTAITTSAGVPPAPTPTTTPPPPQPEQRFALPGCTNDGTAAERPELVKPTCNRQHWIEGMTWTSWGPNEAQGTGIEQSQNCDPACATGEIFRNRVQVLFTGWTDATAGSGCPTSFRYYTQMVVAYPGLSAVPFDFTDPSYAVATKYNGMPAIRYNNLEVNCQAGPNL